MNAGKVTLFRNIVKAREWANTNDAYVIGQKGVFHEIYMPHFEEISTDEFLTAIYGYRLGVSYGTSGLSGSIQEKVFNEKLGIEDAIKIAKTVDEINIVKNACIRAELIALGVAHWDYGNTSFIFTKQNGIKVCIGGDHKENGIYLPKSSYEDAFKEIKTYHEELARINRQRK